MQETPRGRAFNVPLIQYPKPPGDEKVPSPGCHATYLLFGWSNSRDVLHWGILCFVFAVAAAAAVCLISYAFSATLQCYTLREVVMQYFWYSCGWQNKNKKTYNWDGRNRKHGLMLRDSLRVLSFGKKLYIYIYKNCTPEYLYIVLFPKVSSCTKKKRSVSKKWKNKCHIGRKQTWKKEKTERKTEEEMRKPAREQRNVQEITRKPTRKAC